MVKNAFKILPALLLIIVSFSCQENEEPENLLDQVGFEGTLPDGSNFGTTDIRSSNGTGIFGINFTYQGNHDLAIRSIEKGWTLSIEIPKKDFSNNPPIGGSIPMQVVFDYFNIHYPYEDVLGVFMSEKEKAKREVSYSSFDQFRVLLANDIKYYFYQPEYFYQPKGGKVRVLAVNEGMIKDLGGNNIRKIEVTIEFDLPMKASDASTEILEGNLKGVGRFRYREDFYQGEFEKFD
jgi:hypothetical protein